MSREVHPRTTQAWQPRSQSHYNMLHIPCFHDCSVNASTWEGKNSRIARIQGHRSLNSWVQASLGYEWDCAHTCICVSLSLPLPGAVCFLMYSTYIAVCVLCIGTHGGQRQASASITILSFVTVSPSTWSHQAPGCFTWVLGSGLGSFCLYSKHSTNQATFLVPLGV